MIFFSSGDIDASFQLVENRVKAMAVIWSTDEQKAFGAMFKKVLALDYLARKFIINFTCIV